MPNNSVNQTISPQQMEDFFRYARFICDEFNVEIELDSNKAQTNGRVINLPSLSNFSAKELDAMYAILLHEAGHIKYSIFNDESFLQLKTQAHALLANAIEDARIENLLMNDFAGATDIFENLYSDYLVDPQLMQSLFKISIKNNDIFFNLTTYVHNKLLKCKSAPLDKIIPKNNMHKIEQFFNSTGLNSMLDSLLINSWEDVLRLTNEIYFKFVAHYKDNTEKLTFQEDYDKKIKAQEEIEKIKQLFSKHESKINQLKEQIKEQKKQIKNILEKNSSQIQPLEEKIKPLEQKVSSFTKELEQRQNKDYFEKNIDFLNQNISEKQSYLSNISEDIKDINHKIQTGTNSSLKPITETEKNHIQQKQDSLKSNLEAQNNKIQLLNDEINSLNNEISKLQEQLNQNINSHGNPFTEKQKQSIENKINQCEQKKQKQENKLNNLESLLEDLQQQIESLNQKLESGLGGNDKPLTDAQKQALMNKLNTKQNQQSKSITKQQELQKQLQESINSLSSIELDQSFDNMDLVSISEQLNQMTSELAPLTQQLEELLNETQPIQEKIKSINQSLKQEAKDSKQEIFSQLQKLDESTSQQFDVNLLPKFEETPGWEKADHAQKEFDAKASKESEQFVQNGGKMAGLTGSSLRDLQLLLDLSEEKVVNIDLKNIFSQKINFSKMPDNDENRIDNNKQNNKTTLTALKDIRPHIPLTTSHDEVITQNDSSMKKNIIQLEKQFGTFINEVSNIFAQKLKFTKKDIWKGGKEEGQLDARNLWKLPTKSGEDFYEINNHKYINKMSASILIDISGSQDKDETNNGQYNQLLAIAFSKALLSVHVPHEILGFHAPICDQMIEQQTSKSMYNRTHNNLQTVVYKNFKQKDYYGLGHMEISSTDNSDGESIRIAAKRLIQQRSKNKALFIITDGKPFLSNNDIGILDEDLRKALREAIKQKIQIFAFGFSPNGHEFYGNRFCHIQKLNDLIDFCKQIEFKK